MSHEDCGPKSLEGRQSELRSIGDRTICCAPTAVTKQNKSLNSIRIAGFDKWAITNTKSLVITSLPPDVALGAGWDACIASLGRPAAQDGIKALMARGFHKPADAENRLGYYLGQIAR
jgi:hypothetical protein